MKKFVTLVLFVSLQINILFAASSINLYENNHDFEYLKTLIRDGQSNITSLHANIIEIVENLDVLPTIRYNSSINPTENDTLVNPKLENWIIKNAYLFTKNYRKGADYEILDPSNVTSIKSSHFESRKTYVIVHGFIGYGLEDWVLELKDKLLKREDCNVISIDWPAGESWFLPTYLIAANRVYEVGKDTGELLSSLLTYKGLLLAQVHCVGHSLGAHVCGFSGKFLKRKMGRISGLDPAGPMFHKINGTYRLDKTDATFVDVMHTNGCSQKFNFWTDCYGIDEEIGTSDFYPNGGKHQPVCSLSSYWGGAIGCNHKMAYKYFIESLNYEESDTYFFSRPCSDWFSYIIGFCHCGDSPQFMGIKANSELNGPFYLETHRDEPFAMNDPECANIHQWNVFAIVGYVCTALFGICFCVVLIVLVVRNVRECFCPVYAGSCREDEHSLISDDCDTLSYSNLVPNNSSEVESSSVVQEPFSSAVSPQHPNTGSTSVTS